MGLLDEQILEGKAEKELSDEELFLQSQSKPALYSGILERYQEAFLRKAKMVMKTDEGAEDVAQETFTKIYLKAKYFESRGVGSFKSWAYKVLMNTAFTHYKKGRRGEVVAFTDEFAEVFPDIKVSDSQEQKVMADYINSILQRIPDHFAEVLTKFFIEGKTQEEIAQEEGVSVGAIKTKVYRAKEAFRAINGELGEREHDTNIRIGTNDTNKIPVTIT
ncbi:MAG: RNA polymerase sigma factor [bacterium]|nr:RNA polymerase sigma factor [bacterium]